MSTHGKLLRSYALALALIVTAMLIRVALTPYIGWREPFALFYVAAVVACWFGGLGAGVFTVLGSAPITVYFFIRPLNQMSVSYAHDWTALLFFIVLGILLCVAADSFRRTRLALRDERDWSGRVLASVGDAVLVSDARRNLVFMNPQAEQLTEWTLEEARGQPIGNILTMTQQEDGLDLLLLRGRQGRLTSVVKSRSTLIQARGEDAGNVHVLHDVGDTLAMQHALRDSETRLRLLIDFVPHMVWIADAGGTPEFFNRRWHEYTGMTAGQGWQKAMHPDDLPAFVDAWKAMVANGDELVMEVRCRHADGDAWRWHVVRSAPLRDGQQQILRWYGTFTDIDDQKRAQRILTQAARKTDEFLGMLSHELRNPLASISAAASVLSLPALTEADRESASDTVKRQTAAMRRMVDDLLDTARVSHGKIELKLEPTDLDELLQQIIADQRPRLASLGIDLDYACDDRAGALLTLADPVRIQQCVVNLIANAARASSVGQTLRIRLGRGRHDEELAIEVIDQGWGIDAVLLEAIFEPFVQGSAVTGRLGLGLALVRQVAQLHGGDVSAQSAGAGHGSTFRLHLPRSRTAPVSTTPPDSPVRRARVVIIDDERDNASALRLFLKIIGHEVEVAFNAEDGLALIARFQPDVVICDLGLPPPLSGHDVARRIHRDGAVDAPYLIAFSGYGRPDDIERSRQAGFDTHIVKPASPQLINQAIQHGVSLRQADNGDIATAAG